MRNPKGNRPRNRSVRNIVLGAILILVLGHARAPMLAAVIAVEVSVFAVSCVALGWLLAVTRHTWGWRPARSTR